MNFTCPHGCNVEIGLSKAGGQLHRCEPHGAVLTYSKPLKQTSRPTKQGSTLRRGKGRRESVAERAARDHFNETVKAWPCFFTWNKRPCGGCDGKGEVDVFLLSEDNYDGVYVCPECQGDGKHHCSGRKDAHHLIPKQFIRRRLSDWPEEELLAVLFNPLIGAPLCRKAHDNVEAGFDRIYWQDLSPECITYVSSLPDFMLLRLEEECPKREREEVEASAAA